MQKRLTLIRINPNIYIYLIEDDLLDDDDEVIIQSAFIQL